MILSSDLSGIDVSNNAVTNYEQSSCQTTAAI